MGKRGCQENKASKGHQRGGQELILTFIFKKFSKICLLPVTDYSWYSISIRFQLCAWLTVRTWINNSTPGIGTALHSHLRWGRLLDIGGVECEPTDHFSNPVIFQCGLKGGGEATLHMKSRKHKEAFWLTNLVSFRFSSRGETWKITSEKR